MGRAATDSMLDRGLGRCEWCPWLQRLSSLGPCKRLQQLWKSFEYAQQHIITVTGLGVAHPAPTRAWTDTSGIIINSTSHLCSNRLIQSSMRFIWHGARCSYYCFKASGPVSLDMDLHTWSDTVMMHYWIQTSKPRHRQVSNNTHLSLHVASRGALILSHVAPSAASCLHVSS